MGTLHVLQQLLGENLGVVLLEEAKMRIASRKTPESLRIAARRAQFVDKPVPSVDIQVEERQVQAKPTVLMEEEILEIPQQQVVEVTRQELQPDLEEVVKKAARRGHKARKVCAGKMLLSLAKGKDWQPESAPKGKSWAWDATDWRYEAGSSWNDWQGCPGRTTQSSSCSCGGGTTWKEAATWKADGWKAHWNSESQGNWDDHWQAAESRWSWWTEGEHEEWWSSAPCSYNGRFATSWASWDDRREHSYRNWDDHWQAAESSYASPSRTRILESERIASGQPVTPGEYLLSLLKESSARR
ncbi:unnamed protein product [Symbiodinium natans]|uniref:Uncharacterized protein n=1 Tax=Symbiodinium natans TaxID=878477 RepID=A0A812I0G4_9DINO|nr:unnamed protein product [Symbiodinium natans]